LLLRLLLKNVTAAHHSRDKEQHRQPNHLKLVITQVTARDAAAQDEAATGTNHQLPKQHVHCAL
jgi:hypothetical protein